MGAQISGYTPADEDEDLFEPQVREIAGDDFSDDVFQALGDGKPFVRAGALYRHVQQKLESLRKQDAIANMTVKSDAVENINQRNVAEGVHMTVENLEKKTKILRRARVRGVNPRSMKQIQRDIRKLKNDYIKFIGVKYYSTEQDFANDFVAEYFSVLDDPERTVEDFANYYTDRSTIKFNGLEEFIGKEDTIDAMMEKFDLLNVTHQLVSLEVTAPSPRGADYFIMCTSNVTINGDAPRRVMEVFEINYVNIVKSEDYYILRHLFVEQDARPLYAWPEKDVDGRSDRKRRIREEIQRLWDLAHPKEVASVDGDGSLEDDASLADEEEGSVGK